MVINTKTNIRTEYAGMGLKPDGSWRVITTRFTTAADADKHLKEYRYEVDRYPELYTAYAEYKVMKRTVITVTEDWGDI